MARQGRPTKKIQKRGRPTAHARIPAPAPKRGGWRALGIVLVLVILGMGMVVLWHRSDRAKPVAPSVQPTEPATPGHITAMMDTYGRQVPQSISDIQQEELALAEALTQDFPERDAPLALLATVHQYRGDTTQAEALWQQALELNPKRSDLYEKMGLAARRKDQLDQAVTWWQEGLKANPQAPGLRWQIANALVTQGDLDAALELLEVECTITPGAARNHYLLGQIHLKQRAYEKAEAAYQKTLEIQPDYYNAYYGLGMVYTRLKRPEEARTAMEQFRRLKANSAASEDQRIMIDEVPHARKRIALSYVQAYNLYDPKRQAEIGERLLRRALELDPNDAHLWGKLAGHHYVNGRYEEALRLFYKIVDLDPNNPLAHINVGVLHAQMNQLAPAETALRQAVARFPDSSLTHAELAHLYLRAQTHPAEALTLAQRAVALNPAAKNYYLLTWAYDVNGDLDRAMAAIQKAIALEPQNERYRSTYERIQSRR